MTSYLPCPWVAVRSLMAGLLLGSGAGSVLAEDWVGSAAGEWNVSGNWSPATVPDAVDASATFTAAVNNVNLTGFTATVGTLTASQASGNVVLGSTLTTDDVVNLATSSGTPTITLPATRTITLAGPQSQLGASPAAVNLVIQGTVGESAAGHGLVKTDAGTVTLQGSLGYTGETRIAGGTLALAGAALLPSGQNLRFNQPAAATLDVGGTSQAVRTIVMDNTTAFSGA